MYFQGTSCGFVRQPIIGSGRQTYQIIDSFLPNLGVIRTKNHLAECPNCLAIFVFSELSPLDVIDGENTAHQCWAKVVNQSRCVCVCAWRPRTYVPRASMLVWSKLEMTTGCSTLCKSERIIFLPLFNNSIIIIFTRYESLYMYELQHPTRCLDWTKSGTGKFKFW